MLLNGVIDRVPFEVSIVDRWARRVAAGESFPLELAFPFRVRCGRPVSRVMGSAIPLCRCRQTRPGGLSNRPSRADGFNIRQRTSLRVSPPFRALPGRDLPPISRSTATPLGFRSPWHMRYARSGSHGLCLPATFRPQGLVTLSTACSLARLVSLVSCRQRLRDSPFGAFSSRKVAWALPPTHAPPAVTRQPDKTASPKCATS